jgi:MoaA/NifB/PqqE/SkfB family radical SAM enzyme
MPYEDLTPEERYQKELEGRAKWKNAEYEKSLLLTLEITDKCTLECAHCFASSSPRNNTFLEADFVNQMAGDIVPLFQKYPATKSQIIDALSRGKDPKELEGKTSSSIRITGGDPFLHPDLYEIINSFAARREEFGRPVIEVETNG